jgi:hypothetical protein
MKMIRQSCLPPEMSCEHAIHSTRFPLPGYGKCQMVQSWDPIDWSDCRHSKEWTANASDSLVGLRHRIKISNRRAIQRCNVSAFFYAKICSLLARRRSSKPVQRVYWPENVIDWLGKWRPACVMRHARGQKLQSFRRKWPFYMDLYSMSSWYSLYILRAHSVQNSKWRNFKILK